MITIKPWVGKNYENGLDGKRILIVGESPYDPKEDLSENYTIEIVTKYCNVDPESWKHKSHQFFTKIATLLLKHNSADDVSWPELGQFYNQVAFCNFLQGFAGEKPNDYADDSEFEASVGPFQKIVSELKPDVVVVMKTKQLEKFFPKLPMKTIMIQHPSKGLKYELWRSEISKIWE